MKRKNSNNVLDHMERATLKKIKKKDSEKKSKSPKDKKKKPRKSVNIANKIFEKLSRKFLEKQEDDRIRQSLIKSKLEFTPISYVSLSFLATSISFIISLFLFLIILFFDFSSATFSLQGMGTRALYSFWIIPLIPLITFAMFIVYPSLEAQSQGKKVDRELPFASVHMSAISGSMIEPSQIFRVINTSNDYPGLKKEFNKILNYINIHGSDLINAIRQVSRNTPSGKLSELLNGMITTISSGGDLREFFNKRSESLLLEYKLEREKEAKSAETFMDIYISVVIAAPMILMLLLMVMKIGNIGIELSTTGISLIMISGVALLNIFFMIFLQIKQNQE